MKFRRRNLEALGDLNVGNLGRDDPASEDEARYFPYRSSSYITEFFRELDTDYEHDGSTRHRWVADVLEEMLADAHDGPSHPPEVFSRLVDQLRSGIVDAGDFWKLMVGSALLHPLQLGTRRRRRRRDIGEQDGHEPCRRASVEFRRIPAVQAAELEVAPGAIKRPLNCRV